MPYTDPIVLGLLVVSLVSSVILQWRRGLRAGRLAVASVAMFYGLAVISALGMHCLDVLYGFTHHLTSFGTGKPFAWDWHTYSLLLFGASMIWFGVQCVRRALRMGAGADAGSARIEFLRLAGVMLLIVLPIIPIQPLFGVVGSALSVIALAVVGLGGRGWGALDAPTGRDDLTPMWPDAA
jgi:Na+-driven multidrug efflux pump